jgi:hypothetical protein
MVSRRRTRACLLVLLVLPPTTPQCRDLACRPLTTGSSSRSKKGRSQVGAPETVSLEFSSYQDQDLCVCSY